MLVAAVAVAYMNWGRWVADCPADCGSAGLLEPHQGMFHCAECGVITKLVWPANVDEITEALSVRKPKNRNWFPANHTLALRFGLPHGQSVAELNEETEVHRDVD